MYVGGLILTHIPCGVCEDLPIQPPQPPQIRRQACGERRHAGLDPSGAGRAAFGADGLAKGLVYDLGGSLPFPAIQPKAP